jgi:hypothetical protein
VTLTETTERPRYESLPASVEPVYHLGVMQSVLLRFDELDVTVSVDKLPELFLGGVVDHENRVVILIRGNLRELPVSFDWFEPNPVASPDFNQFSIIDYGTAVKLGHYEVSARSILYDFDPVMRQRYRENQIDPPPPDTRPFSALVEKMSPEAQAEVKRLSKEIVDQLDFSNDLHRILSNATSTCEPARALRTVLDHLVALSDEATQDVAGEFLGALADQWEQSRNG